ncbi:MAG: phosphogluconate dehydratase [Arenimonas sp.]
MALNIVIAEVTQRIEQRSRDLRADYETRMRAAKPNGPARGRLSCSNLAHVIAASGTDKNALKVAAWPNIGIVTAYNDMLSAHQPFEKFPDIIRNAARNVRATAQVAGGVPAMCDGVTQGQPGMELSLFSRDVIAMATAVSLSHDSFDAALLLGVCDKIVPGLFIGAAAFGHLPILFVPAGPMPSGIPNPQKAKVRQLYAEGKATREELLEAEAGSYHAPGTCTFYGTANSNQMLMEIMGLHVPGSAFIPPNTPLRTALTEAAVERAAKTTALNPENYLPFAEIIDARSIVNAVVGLMATGGSTNHMLHLIAMARAVGIRLTLHDMADISAATPLMARIYPNGVADVNGFHAAGGMAFVVRELIDAGLVHADVNTVWGKGLEHYAKEPVLIDDKLVWRDPPKMSGNTGILRSLSEPFTPDGGLRVVAGNLGQGVIKVSAVKPEHHIVQAPARVFDDQEDFARAFKAKEITGDVVAVVRFQGPSTNGMPELHQLTPLLSSLQDKGHSVALITDGRMSGASGKIPAAIHITPSADKNGPLSRIHDGDLICLNAVTGELNVLISDEEFAARPSATVSNTSHQHGFGRELFANFRAIVSPADEGASVLF